VASGSPIPLTRTARTGQDNEEPFAPIGEEGLSQLLRWGKNGSLGCFRIEDLPVSL
jgi:hypothetical protein